MELAYGLGDLSDDRKARDTGGFKVRCPLGQLDRIVDVLGDDDVGVAWPARFREGIDEVCDRPSLLVLQGVEKRRHRRAVEPCAHRPEDVLARRPSAEGPALREVRRTYGIAPVVYQGRSRRSITSPERAVALYATVLLVELLSLVGCVFRSSP